MPKPVCDLAIIGGTNGCGLAPEATGRGLSEREVGHLIRAERAQCAEDAAWRRTKLGLRMTEGEIGALDRVISGRLAEGAHRASAWAPA